MKRSSVTIIGMGPRGLSVLERLAAAAVACRLPLDIHLIEPGECGQGVHSARQPQHLLINTLASQVTMFAAPGAVAYAPVCAPLSLTEWARQAGYRRVGDCYYRLGEAGGAPIADSDYLPRCLLGEYLGWVYQQVVAALPACVALTHHRLRANDLRRQDGRWLVELETGYPVASDYVFLTTGHGSNQPDAEDARLAAFAQQHARHNSKLMYVRQVYPLSQLARINADARVAIQGLGLSAHDVIAELTVGRGGAFVAGQGGLLRYQRSGREPKLTLCSRNCLPYAARGVNQKGIDGRHQPRHFTPDAVAALRRRSLIQRGSSQLDFERDLLPLLKREMAEAWQAAQPTPLLMPETLLDQLLFPLRDRVFSDLAAFRRYFRDWLLADLAEASAGNLGSPVKAATDVLRDTRATLQAAIEHGGLTPASHRRFLQVWHPAINRASFGPPLRRNQELLALLDAGVIELLAGPGNQIDADSGSASYLLRTGNEQAPVDVVVVARLPTFFPQSETSLLIRNVLENGLIRPYRNGDFHPGGIDINRAGQPLDRNGQPLDRLWALGYLTEGAHYYTHALPRPQLRSRQVLDAEHCVQTMLATMGVVQRRSSRRRKLTETRSDSTLQSH